MPKNALVTLDKPYDLPHKVGIAILDVVLRVPISDESKVENAPTRAQAISRTAARQASLMAGAMALPPGFLGWLTVLPELVSVWKLQAQMVADIAAVYGKSTSLSREQMLYCLFKHMSAQLFRDVVVRVGERFVIQGATLGFIRSTAKTLGIKVTQTLISKSVSRFVPLIGAVGVGAYAYFDTTQVAKTAIELFSKDILQDLQDD